MLATIVEIPALIVGVVSLPKGSKAQGCLPSCGPLGAACSQRRRIPGNVRCVGCVAPIEDITSTNTGDATGTDHLHQSTSQCHRVYSRRLLFKMMTMMHPTVQANTWMAAHLPIKKYMVLRWK